MIFLATISAIGSIRVQPAVGSPLPASFVGEFNKLIG
jgi:hypothetical protein